MGTRWAQWSDCIAAGRRLWLGRRASTRPGTSRGGPDLVRRVHTDSSYCSASDRRVHFGLGGNTRIGWIEVAWPDGSVEIWDGPQATRLLRLVRGTGHGTGHYH